jgi:hypothetical protein
MFALTGASASNDVLSVLLALLSFWQPVRPSFFTLPLIPVALLLHEHRRRVPVSYPCRTTIGTSVMIILLLSPVLLSWRGADAAHRMPLHE